MDAVLHQESLLKGCTKLAEAIPGYRQILISISDTNSPGINTPRDFSIMDK